MLDTSKLYRLPWTRDHNPNGWIEPTTYCQLKCPFCYRGADLPQFEPVHTPIEEVKKDIDTLIRVRRIGTVTVAGGDPLMYPWLDELIDYTRARNVEVMILTNGVALDENLLRHFKAKDVARVMIHIDKHQGREGITTEEDANKLREEFCNLFRKVGGISLGFIQPISLDDIDDLDVLLPFFKKNADVIDLITINRMQPVDSEALPEERILKGSQLFDKVREVYGLEYSAYLKKTHSDDAAWLFGAAVFSGNRMLGSVDRRVFRFFQEDHYRKTGQYLHCSRSEKFGSRFLLRCAFSPAMWKIALRYLGLKEKGRVRMQLVLLVNTPHKLENNDYDRCEGCPDAMLYGGKLVPSCMLELVKCGLPVEAT